MKKISLFLSVFLLLGMMIFLMFWLPGCSISGQENVEELSRLTVMMFDYGNTPAGESLTRNRFTEYVNECMKEYGIEVEYISVPWADEEEYVKKLMASGTASDIMLCSNRTMVQNYYPEGYSHNLSTYISSFKTPDLLNYIGSERYNSTRFDSGEHWAVQAGRAPMACSNIFIRKDWLDLLGMDIPETPDELYRVIKAFSKLSPEHTVTGEPVIPAHLLADGSIGPVACSFLTAVSDPHQFSIKSNDIYGTMLDSDPGYKEYLRFLNRLYNEELLDRSFLVSGRTETALKEAVLSGRIGVFEAPVNYQISKEYGSLLGRLKSADPDADIISIPPLKNVNDGARYNMSLGSAGNYIFVPLSCTDAKKPAIYLNWLASEDGGGKLFEMTEGSEWIRKSIFILEEDGYYRGGDSLSDMLHREYPDELTYLDANLENALTGNTERSSYYTYVSAFFGSAIRAACKRNTVLAITSPSGDFEQVIEEYHNEIISLGVRGIYMEQESK